MPMAGEPPRCPRHAVGSFPGSTTIAWSQRAGKSDAPVSAQVSARVECAFDIAVVASRQKGTHHIDNIDMSILYIYIHDHGIDQI